MYSRCFKSSFLFYSCSKQCLVCCFSIRGNLIWVNKHLSPHPHPRCGKQLLPADCFCLKICLVIPHGLLLRMWRSSLPGGEQLNNKNILLRMFHDLRKNIINTITTSPPQAFFRKISIQKKQVFFHFLYMKNCLNQLHQDRLPSTLTSFTIKSIKSRLFEMLFRYCLNIF